MKESLAKLDEISKKYVQIKPAKPNRKDTGKPREKISKKNFEYDRNVQWMYEKEMNN